MHRRDFLLGGLATLASASAPGLLHAKTDATPRQIPLYHTHTAESLDLVYTPSRGLDADMQRRLNHFLRDFRTEDVERIDPQLIRILHDLTDTARHSDGVIEIISAYRSPQTNKMLRKASNGVARKSLHMQGRALDIRLRGASTSAVRDRAIALRLGGVGYYRRSDFIHVDTGRVRHW